MGDKGSKISKLMGDVIYGWPHVTLNYSIHSSTIFMAIICMLLCKLPQETSVLIHRVGNPYVHTHFGLNQ